MTCKAQNDTKTKVVSIFGSTGSVGAKTFDIAYGLGYKISAITCNKNHSLAISQAERAGVEYIGVACQESYQIIRDYFSDNKSVEVLPPDKILDISGIKTDICCMAIISPQSYLYTYNVLKNTRRLAISSKEAIITLGDILVSEARRVGAEIIPVDSEHNSLFQCLQATMMENVESLTVTASGGGLRDLEEEGLAGVSISDALRHPTWKMGPKITVDCSTMMNKAIEIIEAAILFGFDIDRIGAIIHPQSIVHGLISLRNNGQIASLYHPDMSLPISHALTYPYIVGQVSCRSCGSMSHVSGSGAPACASSESDLSVAMARPLNLAEVARLDFRDMKDWQKRSIDMAKDAYKNGRTIAFSYGNDYAVNAFLLGKIKFSDIWKVVEDTVSRFSGRIGAIEDIEEAIRECNAISHEFVSKNIV